MSTFSQTSTATTNSIPITPEHLSSALPQSATVASSPALPSPTTPLTPPDSFKQYSSALKARMTAGMAAAMRDLKDDRGGPERAFDVEYGYDEDPIDRHVKLYLTPRKSAEVEDEEEGYTFPKQSTQPSIWRSPEEGSGLIVGIEKDREILASTEDADSEHTVQPGQYFRPGLINFHRSLGSSVPSLSRTSSNSTPWLSSDLITSGQRSEGTTPGSVVSSWSESSFEALGPEEVGTAESPFLVGRTRTRSDGSRGGDDTSEKQSPGISSITTELPTTSRHRHKPNLRIKTSKQYSGVGLPRVLTPGAHRSQIPVEEAPPVPPLPENAFKRKSLFSRPSLLRPRPRPVAAVPNGQESAINDVVEEESWLEGRTISETMIAEAGLRCQAGRGVRSTRI